MSKWPRMTEERVSELVRLSMDDFMVEAEAEIRATWAERDRLAAENELLNKMRGAYEEASDLREAREDALADAEEERSELRVKCERLEAEAGALREENERLNGWEDKASELGAKCERLSAERDRLAARVDELERAEPISCSECCRLTVEVERLEGRVAELERSIAIPCESCPSLEAEAGALREALTYYSTREYDSRTSTDGLIQYVADEALSSDAGKQALAQIEAGRALAEAARELLKTGTARTLTTALAAWGRAAKEGRNE